MTIGEKIRELRRKNDVTQEKLADHLGISYQSVSKWENNNALPDITLVVPIANFFGVSTDELFDHLGADEEREVEEYLRREHEIAHKGLTAERVELLREAQAKYPRNHKILYALMVDIYIHGGNGDSDEYAACAREAAEIGERILGDCTDADIRADTIDLLVRIYGNADFPFADEEKAVAYAKSAPSMWNGREVMLVHAYDAYANAESREKKLEQIENNIISLTSTLAGYICDCGIARGTHAERLYAYEIAIGLWNTIIPDGNFLWYHVKLERFHEGAAEHAAGLFDREKTLYHLREARRHAEIYDSLPEERMNFTSPFVRRASIAKATGTTNMPGTEVELFRKSVSFDSDYCYAFLRDDEEFCALLL